MNLTPLHRIVVAYFDDLPLIPQLPNVLIRVVVEYFDDFGKDAVESSNWDCAKDFEDFQKNVKPRLQPRRFDDDLFRKKCPLYSMSALGQEGARLSIEDTLAQLYRAGMSFWPFTLRRIAHFHPAFVNYLIDNFLPKLEEPVMRLKQEFELPLQGQITTLSEKAKRNMVEQKEIDFLNAFTHRLETQNTRSSKRARYV